MSAFKKLKTLMYTFICAKGSKTSGLLTFGEVAEASNGNSPPQAMIRLSASWDIR